MYFPEFKIPLFPVPTIYSNQRGRFKNQTDPYSNNSIPKDVFQIFLLKKKEKI